MKKLVITLAFLLLLAVSFMSCRSSKPPCPAYPSTQATQQVELHVAR